MDVLKTLLNLCSFESVSGKEKNLTNYLYKALEKYSKNIKKRKKFNKLSI